MTPNESKSKMVNVVDETVAALPGEWTTLQSPESMECSINGASGVMYTYAMQASSGADPEADADKVQDLWHKLEIDAAIHSTGAGTAAFPVVRCTGGPVQRMAFLANPQGYGITGVSICVPGNVVDIKLHGGD